MTPNAMTTWALAQRRHSDLLREAEQARLAKLASAAQPRTGSLKERWLHLLAKMYPVTALQQPARNALPVSDCNRQSACVTC